MKQLRQILVWLTISALVLSLVGCGNNTPTTPQTEPPTSPVTDPPTDPPITADQVYASVADAMAGAQATRLKMVLSYEMVITEGKGDNAVTTEVFMDMTTDTMISANPFGAYSMTEMLTRTGDAETGYKMENYYVEENDSVVLYIGMLGFWSRIDTYQNADQYMISLYDSTSSDSVWSGNPLQDMTLDENTSSLNGVEVYILRGSIPAGDLGDAFSSLGVSDPSILKDLSMPVVYYVDAQTCQILRMEANFAFLADILDDVIAQSMAIMEDEDISFDLTIPDVVFPGSLLSLRKPMTIFPAPLILQYMTVRCCWSAATKCWSSVVLWEWRATPPVTEPTSGCIMNALPCLVIITICPIPPGKTLWSWLKQMLTRLRKILFSRVKVL